MVAKFTLAIRKSWTGDAVIAAPESKAKVADVAAAAEDEFDDLFDADPEAEAAAAAAMKEKATANKAKKVKAAPIAKSLIIWEVKPWGEDTDL